MKTKFNIGQRVRLTSSTYWVKGTGKTFTVERIYITPNKRIYYSGYVKNWKVPYQIEERELEITQ